MNRPFFALSFKIIKFLASFPFVLDLNLNKIRHVCVTARNIQCDTNCCPPSPLLYSISYQRPSPPATKWERVILHQQTFTFYKWRKTSYVSKRFNTLSSRNVNCIYMWYLNHRNYALKSCGLWHSLVYMVNINILKKKNLLLLSSIPPALKMVAGNHC